jgi:hypothetical protein
MSEWLEAAGAPVEQGRAQGESAARAIRGAAARLRAELPWLARRALLRRVRATSGRALETQLPWQRERIEGIAHASRTPEWLLLLGEALTRVQGAVYLRASGPLQASFDLPRQLESLVVLRHSVPDAGGFASAELVLAPLAGCLCGVNAEGLAAVCTRDRSRDELSLRFLAQELFFRARDLDAGIDHLRRRAAYAGGTGEIVAADSAGRVCRLELRGGRLEVHPAPAALAGARCPQLELDPRAGRLTWLGADGKAPPLRLDAVGLDARAR